MSTAELTERDDPTWLAWRAAGITATDIANAYTGDYGGMYGVVANKLGLLAPAEYSDRMARGHRWEERIADLVHVATGMYVHNEQAWCENADTPTHRATIDGMLAPGPEASIDDIVALLEEKTNGIEVRPSWDRWTIQTLWQIHCTGIDRALIARAVIDDATDELVTLQFRWVDRDDFVIGHLIDLAAQIAGHVEAGTLPDPDSPSTLDLVKEVTAIADPAALPVDLSDVAGDVARYHEIKAAVKAVTDEEQRLGALIRSRVGTATRGECDGFTVSFSNNQKVRTPEGNAAFLAAHPDLAKDLEIDTKRAEAEAPDDYKAIPREPLGSRSLTVKEKK